MKKAKFRFWLVLSLLWTAVIFVSSMMPGEASGQLSGGLLGFFQTLIPGLSHHLLRKLGHFVAFAGLGLCYTGLFFRARRFLLLKPAFCCLLAALCDETIQSFRPGRNGQIPDIWLDLCGAAFGIALAWLIFRLKSKK